MCVTIVKLWLIYFAQTANVLTVRPAAQLGTRQTEGRATTSSEYLLWENLNTSHPKSPRFPEPHQGKEIIMLSANSIHFVPGCFTSLLHYNRRDIIRLCNTFSMFFNMLPQLCIS